MKMSNEVALTMVLAKVRRGVAPVCFLNAELNAVFELNPESNAMAKTVKCRCFGETILI